MSEERVVDARYARPIVGVVDPLGNLEVAGPIPAEEMGLRARRTVRLVGTAYDPSTVGEAYERLGVTPRFMARPGCSQKRRRGSVPTSRTAYQARTKTRVASRGEQTRALFRMHEPQLAGREVAIVVDVERRRVPVWLVAPALVAASMALVVGGLLSSWGDPAAKRGHYEGKTEAEIRADVDREVEWYAMEISVADAMSVREGQTRVEARLENVEANHCDQRVRIYETDDPSDVLYESGAIAPGEYVQFIDLAHPLDVGTHEVTVEFQGYEREPSLVSNEGVPLGHDTFGASCAAEVTIYCSPAAVRVG